MDEQKKNGRTKIEEAQNAEAAERQKQEVQQMRRKICYTVEDFANAPDKLRASSDIIRAAFREAGKEEATIMEAMEIVKKFKGRKVSG